MTNKKKKKNVLDYLMFTFVFSTVSVTLSVAIVILTKIPQSKFLWDYVQRWTDTHLVDCCCLVCVCVCVCEGLTHRDEATCHSEAHFCIFGQQ